MAAQSGLGLPFGLFPGNLLHNIVHVLLGIRGPLAGVAAYFGFVRREEPTVASAAH